MAGTSLLALIDDIASVLDDVALLTKVASKKTAGVVGDDLALNAQQVTGLAAERELPVVWAVAKGSLVNKAILVPAALLISAVTPWLVTPLLMFGGAFLCFEGVEKIVHKFFHREERAAEHAARVDAIVDDNIDLVAFEKDKIRGAVRTDFVLSAEIMAIALGAVAEANFPTRVIVLTLISLGMTVGVYGLVAMIVKLDDLAFVLSRQSSSIAQQAGKGLLKVVPVLMKGLGIFGTLAMFLVGGGIFVHGLPALHHALSTAAEYTSVFAPVVEQVGVILVGVVVGAVALGIVNLVKRVRTSVA